MLNFDSAFVNTNEICGSKPLNFFSGFVMFYYKLLSLCGTELKTFILL